MSCPCLLLVWVLTLTQAGVPGGRAQPEVAQQEAAMAAELPGLDNLLRQVERLLLQEDLQHLGAELGDRQSEPQVIQPDWLIKRQHPGKREEEAEVGVEEEDDEGGAVGPHKRQHPGRRENAATWSVDDVSQQKRQHPGRRSSWLGYIFTKRQHPGKRLVDPKTQSWEEEEKEEEQELGLMPEKRQHPGKRALGVSCGPWQACGQASLLLGLLDDLSRGPGVEKRQHPGRRATWAREPLEE